MNSPYKTVLALTLIFITTPVVAMLQQDDRENKIKSTPSQIPLPTLRKILIKNASSLAPQQSRLSLDSVGKTIFLFHTSITPAQRLKLVNLIEDATKNLSGAQTPQQILALFRNYQTQRNAQN